MTKELMIEERYPYYLAGEAVMSDIFIEVRDKYSGELVSSVSRASALVIEDAISRGDEYFRSGIRLSSHRRREVLDYCVRRFEERFDEFAHILCVEAGKPIRDARGEVSRLIDTFRIASREAGFLHGEVMNMDITERSEGYRGMWRRFPIGLCSFISPFNFPLNLVAHKVAPALAVGNPFILKPATRTPIGALLIGEVLSECDLPSGYFSILPCSRGDADLFVEDDRFKLLSFTGSHTVGWDFKVRAGKKKVLLELGGNAACVVDEGVDIDDAVSRIVVGAFYQSGQTCISVQRLYIHSAIYDEFKEKLLEATRLLISGDPRKEETFIGPMIAESEACRLEDWVNSALSSGASLLCGGSREGSLFEATLLEGVSDAEDISCKEAFGPVALLSSFSSFEDALDRVNESSYGLQAGVFTNDIGKAFKAWDRLDVGGVLINEIPSWRVDHMPYGGVKDSGNTREGISFAIEEITEIKLLVIRDRS